MLKTRTGYIALFMLLVILMACTDVLAESVDCGLCHGDIAKKKQVHAALKMGCAVCHANIDAENIPHKTASNAVKGLSADQPDLCYMCHDQTLFSGKKHLHPPVLAGMCSSCHDPHSSDNEKLLKHEMPALCFTCHDKTKFEGEVVHQPAQIGLCIHCHAPHQSNTAKLLSDEVPGLCYQCHQKEEFTRKNIHIPVAAGMCLYCHNPHASKDLLLLSRKPVSVCVECHPDLPKRPHVLAGKQGHPVGLSTKKKKPANDSTKKEKDFYCGNCHNPHSSEWPKLFRYEAYSAFELCRHCHKK